MKVYSLQSSVFSLQSKKIISLVIGCWLLVVLLGGCAQKETQNINSKGANIICFGDSVTFGYGANIGEDYPSDLSKMINTPVINAGIDGDTTTEALKRIESDVLDRDPLLVIIEFGGNDFLRKIPKEVTVNNIKEIVERVQAKGAMAAIVDISAGMFLREYRVALCNLTREKRTIFIPTIFEGIITNPHMKSDFLHPNADGYKIIAQRIYRAIIPYLNRNTLSKKYEK